MRRFTLDDLQPETVEARIEGRQISLSILPRMGANLVSFRVDGREFIHFDADRMLTDQEAMTGAFQMFPTPCRLTGSKYPFGGREILQRKGGEDVFIHGLVRDEPFASCQADLSIVSQLDITPGHPVYEGFPFAGRLTTTHRIIANGMELSFAFENRGDVPASVEGGPGPRPWRSQGLGAPSPVGYGLHPFWRIPGKRSDVMVTIPADNITELVDLIPTGKLLPVAGTDYDWREWRSLEGVEIDAVFYPKPPEATAGIRFLDEGLQLTLQASPNMGHMICYAPAGQPFVCLENLTCTPDAPNLYAAGFEEVSGLAIVPPGDVWSGWIRYTVETIP